MSIYLLNEYCEIAGETDLFARFVVCAEDPEEAETTHPSHGSAAWNTWRQLHSDMLMVVCMGKAISDMSSGLIVSEYRIG